MSFISYSNYFRTKNLFPTNINVINPDLLPLQTPNLVPSAGGQNDITLDVSITPHPVTPSNITFQRSDLIEDSSADRTFSSKRSKFREIAAQHYFKLIPIIRSYTSHLFLQTNRTEQTSHFQNPKLKFNSVARISTNWLYLKKARTTTD
jgi:hypothetical protein